MDDREEKEVKEQDLNRLPYLKGVILEGLRRHPPGHFVLPHCHVTEDTVLNDYLIHKDGVINFMVADMGWDPKIWEDLMAFKPEGEGFVPVIIWQCSIWSTFVANLVWNFEWKKPANVANIDLSEKQEFTVVMKYPLEANISPRI
ncbi:hypothetical protein L6164_035312 [Bauhinia variegata]|uniref:Uncharacterized protein n=1 Tax=Bauhinia variegata TaxID=167791 RepID=A0ACB9KDL4_BAUVA|nr:hypothetical protein L6164_035312 [Bauhinia variegata]